MEKNIIKTTCYCGHCHRQLPADDFYLNSKTQTPDRYCIACRKEINRTRYRKSHCENGSCHYPVITDTTDAQLRMALIMNALRVVHESIERKRKRLCETEYLDDLKTL